MLTASPSSLNSRGQTAKLRSWGQNLHSRFCLTNRSYNEIDATKIFARTWAYFLEVRRVGWNTPPPSIQPTEVPGLRGLMREIAMANTKKNKAYITSENMKVLPGLRQTPQNEVECRDLRCFDCLDLSPCEFKCHFCFCQIEWYVHDLVFHAFVFTSCFSMF